MKLEVGIDTIQIIPENDMEAAYLQNTFNLREKADHVKCVRRQSLVSPNRFFLEIKPNADETRISK